MTVVFSVAVHASWSADTENQRSHVIDLSKEIQTPCLSLERELLLEFSTRQTVKSAKETGSPFPH